MKVVTFLGTRPEIIRLSRVIARLDSVADHVLIHTGQNFEPSLSDRFFTDLQIRAPNATLQIRGNTFASRLGQILSASHDVLRQERPDRVLVLGDTDSAMAAVVAKRMGFPVFHMEAGNRCFDDRVPEETNRRIIDHCSSVLMPYTERSRTHLLREGVPPDSVYVVGNPINEVLTHYREPIEQSSVLEDLGLTQGRYVLATMHRQETVDDMPRLAALVASFERVGEDLDLQIVVSLHPRTRSRLFQHGLELSNRVRLCEPFGFFEFVALERHARCVLTDSGTVQEECCIFGVPTVTLRDTTERPETLECGSNVLGGVRADNVSLALRAALDSPPIWTPPTEYRRTDVSTTVTNLVLGYREFPPLRDTTDAPAAPL